MLDVGGWKRSEGVEEGRSDVDAAATAAEDGWAVGVAELGRVVVGAGEMGSVGRSSGTVGVSGWWVELGRGEESVLEAGDELSMQMWRLGRAVRVRWLRCVTEGGCEWHWCRLARNVPLPQLE